MGMYDDVKYEMKCPKCKTIVKDFQSKDGICCLHTLEFWQVDNFYASCPKCGKWIEFKYKKILNKKRTIKDYEMTTKNTKETKVSFYVKEKGSKKRKKVTFVARR